MKIQLLFVHLFIIVATMSYAAEITGPSASATPEEYGPEQSLIDYWAKNPVKSIPLEGIEDIRSLAFSPADAEIFALGETSGKVSLWSVSSRKKQKEFNEGIIKTGFQDNDPAVSVAFSLDGTMLSIGRFSGGAIVWNVQSGEAIARHTFGKRHQTHLVAISPDSATLAIGLLDHTVRLLNLKNHKVKKLAKLSEEFSSMAFSPIEPILAIGSRHGTITIWNIQTNKKIGEISQKHLRENPIAFSPDGMLAFIDTDGISLWNVTTGQKRLLIEQPGPDIVNIAFSFDGLLAGGFSYGAIILWNGKTGKEISRFLAHNDELDNFALSPDGKTIVSAGLDTVGINHFYRFKLWKAGESL